MSPEEEWMLTTFVGVGCLSIIIWDILNSLVPDYRIVLKRNFNVKTFSFIVSRISTLIYLTLAVLQMTRVAPPEMDHNTMKIMASIFFLISRATTALLFYFRVIAIYQSCCRIVTFFTTTWLLTVAGGILSLGPVWKSLNVVPPWQYFLPGALAELLNDTLVYVAISRKIRLETPDAVPNARFGRLMILRLTDVQRIAETFLQDSQIYYFIAICMNLATIITYFSIDSHSPLKIVLIYPNTIIMHIMATKVYRNLRLGRPGLLGLDSTSTWIADQSGSTTHPYPPPNLRFLVESNGPVQRCTCGMVRPETRLRFSREDVDVDENDIEAGHMKTRTSGTDGTSVDSRSQHKEHPMEVIER
ncbi:hypothetical protein CPB83DRAFT_860335 [Crepidotus variabilis]|uniref:Uncharacterized protein n=1 Tax=Crepidotus variabilis TaxID=179855 RepID=A0A9P6JL89_9AGAR|nr:hypothetical protein CPB83DRAFT_860335 [Crepidotus variabilis]